LVINILSLLGASTIASQAAYLIGVMTRLCAVLAAPSPGTFTRTFRLFKRMHNGPITS